MLPVLLLLLPMLPTPAVKVDVNCTERRGTMPADDPVHPAAADARRSTTNHSASSPTTVTTIDA
jgi:hypothetical protein